MSLYDKASLVLIPSGTKTSKVYSQKPVSGDGDFTFSRSTAATRVNASGNIEKETQNLLVRSNDFSNSSWTKSNISVTGGQSGYDGSSDAWQVSVTAASYYMAQNLVTSNVQTFSVYAKAGTLNWLMLGIGGGTFTQASFDLQNGVLGSTTNAIDSSIESVGNGWYRCSVVINKTTSNRVIYPAAGDNNVGSSSGYIYVQDAQSENGLVARDYIETTTTAIYGGITDNVPRLDYTDSSCPALLLEPQRTNKFLHSEYTDGYFKNNVAWTYNAAESPEGVNNALLSTFSGAGYFGDALSVTAGLTYTFSLYLKGDAGKSSRIYLDGNGSGGYFFTQEQILLDGTWTRYELTYTIPAGASSVTLVVQNYSWGGHPSVTELYSYGLQFEAGSYATSYIPTYGSAVTRNREQCSENGLSALIGQTEGTIYWEGSFQDASNPILLQLAPNSGNYTSTIYFEFAGSQIRMRVYDSGTQQAYFATSASAGTQYKIALAYKENDIKGYVNGSSIGTDTLATIQSGLNNVHIGELRGSSLEAFNGSMPKQVMLFKTRLTNEELATLTTI